MRYRKLDENGDYVWGSGQKDLWRDVPQAVAQACKTRLELWTGEWFLNTQEGTPYLQGVVGKHPQPIPNLTIIDRAQGTQGATGVSEFESVIDPDTRGLDVSFLLGTIYGPTAVEIANYGNI